MAGGTMLIASLPVLMSASSVSASGTATMYLAPASLTVAPGSDIAVAIHEDSGSDTINAAQAFLSYTSNLTFDHIDNSPDFSVVAGKSGGNGSVSVILGVGTVLSGGPGKVSGDNVIATVHFKASGSGTASVDFTSGSAVLRSTDSVAEALTTTGATYTINSAATMTLSPATKTVSQGTNFDVQIYEDSGADQVNAVSANLSYPSNLTYVSTAPNDTDWPISAVNSGGNGLVKISRGVSIASGTATPLTGKHLIATVTFKASSAGSAAVSFTTGTAIIRASDNLAEASVNTGGIYTITSSSSPSGGGSTSGGNNNVTTAKTSLPKSYTSTPPASSAGVPSAPITTTADNTAPAITDVKAAKQADKSFVITWQTSEPATSEVDYGVSDNLYLSKQVGDMVTSHSVNFSAQELSADTTYHFIVKSADAAGNVAASEQMTFDTGTLHVTTTEVAVGAGGAALLGAGAWMALAGGLKIGGAAAGGIKAGAAAGMFMGPTQSIIAGGNAPPSPDNVVKPEGDGPTVITPQNQNPGK